MSLSIEEMVSNIVAHGFKDGREHYIDIKIIVAQDEIILRIRDNGVAFNPLQYDADGEHYGIAMIRGMAKDFQYKNAVRTNNLTVVL